MSHKTTVMAVVNQKGGTGKTTTCENLGVGLAKEGKKVLLVDFDPQGSLTISLGVSEARRNERNAIQYDGEDYAGTTDRTGRGHTSSPREC